jgi:hypothetical protein
MRSIARMLLLVALATTVGGCDDETTPTEPTPPVMVTETFNGTLTINGAQTHSFTTQAAGSLTATLTTLSVESGVTVGLSFGIFTPSTNQCQIVVDNSAAIQGTRLTGQVSSAGNYCLRIYDASGRLAAAANYTLSLEHP